MNNDKITINKQELIDMIRVITDMWEQFSCEGTKDGLNVQWTGGLSTLEHCEDWLSKYELINEHGILTEKANNIIYKGIINEKSCD